MKFYIFADDSDIIVSTPKNSRYSSSSYDDALKMFNEFNRNYKYSNSYLLVDFELKHQRTFTESIDNLKEQVIVPFLIIREFHYDKDKLKSNASGRDGKIVDDLTIRHDCITLESDGFIQEFKDNQSALNKFLYLIENHIPATMNLYFIDESSDNFWDRTTNVIYKRKIASSIEVIRSKPIPMRRIRLEKSEYIGKNKDVKSYAMYNMLNKKIV